MVVFSFRRWSCFSLRRRGCGNPLWLPLQPTKNNPYEHPRTCLLFPRWLAGFWAVLGYNRKDSEWHSPLELREAKLTPRCRGGAVGFRDRG